MFRLSIGNDHYAIKVHAPWTWGASQPYINEMLQIQTLAAECADALAGLHVEIPMFYFASGQVSCTEYIPNAAALAPSFAAIHYAMVETLNDTIRAKKHNDPTGLWKDVSPDAMHQGKLPRANYRQRNNGSVVWIDPIIYAPGLDAQERLRDTQYPSRHSPHRPWNEHRDHYLAAQRELRRVDRLMHTLEHTNDILAWFREAEAVFRTYELSYSDSVGAFHDHDFRSHMDQILAHLERIIRRNHHIHWMPQEDNENGVRNSD